MNKNLIFDKSYIDGLWVSEGDLYFDVFNPSNNKKIARVFDGGSKIAKKAVDAANNAFSSWSNKTAKYRSEILEKWCNLIIENSDDLAEIMTLECGKPIKESKAEVLYGASVIEWVAEEGNRIYRDVIPSNAVDQRSVVLKQPIGVVAAITPWNFPLAMITRKVAPALAAGCTVVIRPSEETPLVATAILHLAEAAGFPPGVITLVLGKDPSSIGKVLCKSNLVKKISFTGSTEVGKILFSQSASSLKKLSLELGGNAPFIVFEDADIDKAVEGAINSKFRNSGQTCVCVNRILIHDDIYNQFSLKLCNEVSKLKVGDGFDKDVKIGPMINKKAISKTNSFVEDAIKKGGEVLTGGNPIGDCFFEPTVIGGASTEMKFSKEEIFGPVVPLYKFSSDEEAVKMANDTIYGLASYFYSKNISRCWKVAEELEYGMVGINEGLISSEVAPFGGVKFSGQGREGSKYGIEDYIEIKYMCFGNIK